MSSQTPSYHGYRFPPDIISHAVWLYHRFSLSFRDAEDLLAQRGITVTYETIRQWCLTFGPAYARTLRRRRGRLGDTWYLDEVFATIQGQRRYLWRAVDQDGDLLVQSRRNRRAAMCDVNLTKPLPSILLGDWLRIGLLCQLRPQLDCEHHSAACRGRSVTLVGAGGWWPDPQLD